MSSSSFPFVATGPNTARALLVTAVVTSCASILTAADADSLVTGVLARAQAIHSGRLVYRLSTQVHGPRPRQAALPFVKEFTFAGDLWTEHARDSSLVLVTRKEFTLRFEKTRQSDGRIRDVAVVTAPTSFREKNERDRRPYFAGTFWHQKQLEYVRRNRDRVRLVPNTGRAEANVEVCELDVPAADTASAFAFRTPRLREGGRIRFHVDTSRGFALPLVEIVATDGAVEITYESRDFVRFTDQIYFPRSSTMKLQAPSGHTETWSYSIAPERINEEFPKSAFDFELPAHTQIQDTRGNKEAERFELETPTRANTLFGTETSSPDLETPRSRWLIVAVTIVIASALFLAIWRSRKKQ